MQKAGIVDLVKSRTNDMTLAIGDGEFFQLMLLNVEYIPPGPASVILFFFKFDVVIHIGSSLCSV